MSGSREATASSRPELLPVCCLGTAVAVGVVASVIFRRRLKNLKAEKEREYKRKNELALELMGVRNSFFDDKESVELGTYPKFVPNAGDVFIVTYPKCGTTWTQHILHGLRSCGSMEFGEITEVSPWDTVAHSVGLDLNSEQRDAAGVVHTPRLFKSHSTFETVGRTEGCDNTVVGKAKYVYVVRDPKDAFLSFHRFLPAYCGLQPSDMSHETFCDGVFAGVSNSGTIWNHFAGWWEHFKDPNVLFLCFETLLSDLRGCVELLAKFAEIPVDEPTLSRVITQSEHKFMSRDDLQHHFDDHFVGNILRKAMRLVDDAPKTTKVQKSGGKAGHAKKELSKALHHRFDTTWVQKITPKTGLRSYSEMRQAIEKENRLRFQQLSS